MLLVVRAQQHALANSRELKVRHVSVVLDFWFVLRNDLLIQQSIPVNRGKEWMRADVGGNVVALTCRVPKSGRWVSLEQAGEHISTISAEPIRKLEWVFQQLSVRHVEIGAVEWRQADCHLVQQNAQAPPVYSFSVTLLEHNFRRNIIRRPDNSIRSLLRDSVLGESKVGELDKPIHVQEDVLRLEIAIDNIHFMQIFQSHRNLCSIEGHPVLLKSLLPFNKREDVAPVDKIQNKTQFIVCLKRIM
mmetsp:Transcript_20183/g.47156  ORF Transcript_20183/g.47156 Transcript_20183/m.47156 type:complete len:246 (-) Transcript_20183:444-1181(-)